MKVKKIEVKSSGKSPLGKLLDKASTKPTPPGKSAASKKTVLDSNLVVRRGNSKADTMSVGSFGKAYQDLGGNGNKAVADALKRSTKDKKGNFILGGATAKDRDAFNYAKERKSMNSKYSSVDKKK